MRTHDANQGSSFSRTGAFGHVFFRLPFEGVSMNVLVEQTRAQRAGTRTEEEGMVQSRERLEEVLRRIDSAGYKAYRDIKGAYAMGRGLTLVVDHVQGDPFASPSRVRIIMPWRDTGLPDVHLETEPGARAVRDFLTRTVVEKLRGHGKAASGSGKSGVVSMDRPGQEILDRTSVVLVSGGKWWTSGRPVPDDLLVEFRLRVGLPAAGRRVLGRQAAHLLCRFLPDLVRDAVDHVSPSKLRRHVEVALDQDYLRRELEPRGLVAFVADGAILPRESGVSDRPMPRDGAIPFESPESLRVTFDLPSGERITGMGIPKGLTLVVGGGYHGKSTLLAALERGVYDHVPGDGRELCVSSPAAVKIRAEDGRRVEQVDISWFIDRLPLGKDTTRFSTDDASGSTSQAANIVEALELGADLLLLDEDTSATNFLIRDARMQALVSRDREPITPLLDRVRDILSLGCSLVLVLGGNGDYFELADTVISMDTYRPVDVTERARAIARELPSRRSREAEPVEGPPTERIPSKGSFDPRRGRREVKITASDTFEIRFGEETMDLSALEQLVDRSQTRAIGDGIHLMATRFVDGRSTLRACLEALYDIVATHGLDELARHQGDRWREYAMPRPIEVGAAVNRLRSLRMTQAR